MATMTVSEQLRRAIADSGLSHRTIAQGSGVSEPVLSRFTRGRQIRSGVLDRLARYFKLELAIRVGKGKA
jgi:transcriptional regulator with XRE-family HTH domain